MHQAIRPAQVHKHAEVANARHGAVADLPLAQFLQQPVLLLRTPLLKRGPLREDHPVPTPVDLDHFEPQRAAHGLRQGGPVVPLRAHHLAERHEGVHALHVDQQSAFVEPGHGGVEDLAGLIPALQDPPALLPPRPVHGEQHLRVRFLGLGLDHVDQERVADRERAPLIRRDRLHLAGRHDAFRLRADVQDQHLAAGADERPVEDIPPAQLHDVTPRAREEFVHGGPRGGRVVYQEVCAWRSGRPARAAVPPRAPSVSRIVAHARWGARPAACARAGRVRRRCWRWPIFPGGCPPSIVGAAAFHFRVRDGNGWGHRALITSTTSPAR